MTDVVKRKTALRETAAKKKVILTAESPAVSPHHHVAVLAYQLWEDGGRQHGSNAEDWLQAEQQLAG